jgi:hypothetical protein
MARRGALFAILRAGACLGLAACGFAPMELPRNSDLKPGPGLLTGRDGEFVIHSGAGGGRPPPRPPPPG